MLLNRHWKSKRTAASPRRRAVSAAAAAAILSALAGCNETAQIRAVQTAGRVELLREGPDGCSQRLIVRDAETGATVWHIARTWAHPLGDRPPVCRDIFPLPYGRSPPGFRDVVAPVPLAPGRSYLIANEDQEGSVGGRFELGKPG